MKKSSIPDMTQHITPAEKVSHIRLFARELAKFYEQHPAIIKDLEYFIVNLPTTTRVTPFHRLVEDDKWILKLFEKCRDTLLKRLYLADWEFVNVISYQQFFIEHLNIVDIHYQTSYNILWDDIIYTPMYVPRILKKYECQKHLYLRKGRVSI